jgi:hypothetical protein
MILRRLTNAFRKQNWFTLAMRPLSAISRLELVMALNDWTEVTLPDAEPDDRSRLGPKRTLYSCASGASYVQPRPS